MRVLGTVEVEAGLGRVRQVDENLRALELVDDRVEGLHGEGCTNNNQEVYLLLLDGYQRVNELPGQFLAEESDEWLDRTVAGLALRHRALATQHFAVAHRLFELLVVGLLPALGTFGARVSSVSLHDLLWRETDL